jgi:hypothetical protein
MAEISPQKIVMATDLFKKHAEGVYERRGRHMKWWKRFVICGIVDALDWLNLAIGWIPGVHKVTGIAIDIVQVFLITMVLGPRATIPQIVEGFSGLIPYGGVFLEAFPTSLLTCYVMWVEEKGQTTRWMDYGMEFLFGIIGLLSGILMWMAGWIPWYWVVGTLTLGILLAAMRRIRLVLTLANQQKRWWRTRPVLTLVNKQKGWWRIEIPAWWVVSGAMLMVLPFTVSGISLWVIADAESYRMTAWHQLVREDDPQIADAINADTPKPGQQNNAGKGSMFGNIVKKIRTDIHKSAEKKSPYKNPIMEFVRRGVVELTKEKQKVSAQPQQTKLTVPISAVEQKIKTEATELHLGPEGTELYGSEYVLDRAKKIYRGKFDSRLWWTRFTGLLTLFGILATVQAFIPRPAEKPAEDASGAKTDEEGDQQ